MSSLLSFSAWGRLFLMFQRYRGERILSMWYSLRRYHCLDKNGLPWETWRQLLCTSLAFKAHIKAVSGLYVANRWHTTSLTPGVMQTPGILNDVLMLLSVLCVKCRHTSIILKPVIFHSDSSLDIEACSSVKAVKSAQEANKYLGLSLNCSHCCCI